MLPWTVVLPVKPSAVGKSRLGLGAELARAIALDTIDAARRVPGIQVVVVTADPTIVTAARELGVIVVVEDAPAGIAAAIERGLAGTSPDGRRAALLADLPALRPDELAAALDEAAQHDRAFVPDAEGTGTTLVTARGGRSLVHRFGEDSAAEHLAAGLTALPIPASSTIRRDVDVLAHLTQATAAGIGPRTAVLLARA
jgi:2-phospho-L-lactate guanylyltransferase